MKEYYWVSELDSPEKEKLEALNDFLLRLKLKNKSPRTIDGYRRSLEHYLSDCPLPLRDLIPEDVFRGIREMTERRQKATKRFYISILASFFNHCRNEGVIDKNLIKHNWRPKLSKPLPRYLTKSEQSLLKVAAENISLRDRVMIEFLLSTGCRCNELRQLDITDIDIAKRTAKLLGKGHKYRTVFFGNMCPCS